MNPDLLLPLVASGAWLILAIAGMASYRLKWGQMVTMVLVWIVIFGGLFVLIEWFMVARGSASDLL